MSNIRTLSITLLFLAIVFNGCNKSFNTSENKSEEKEIQEQSLFAIKNVNIIPLTKENEIIKNATITIKDKKIVSINKPIPNKATIIDGKGKWLIPGIINMRVHNLADINLGSNYPTKAATHYTNTQDFMALFVVNGVTTVFELSGRVEHFAQRNESYWAYTYGFQK